MHFDDRLSTVLRHSASSGTLARIQYRQLVDILAQAPRDLDSDLAEEGFARLASLSQTIRPADQTELIRQSLLRLTNPRLLLQLARIDPHVASAALARTSLSQTEWLDLIPALPVHARGILRHRRDLPPAVNELLERLGIGDRALPPAALPHDAHASTQAAACAEAPVAIEAPVREETLVREEAPGRKEAAPHPQATSPTRARASTKDIAEGQLTKLAATAKPYTCPADLRPATAPELAHGLGVLRELALSGAQPGAPGRAPGPMAPSPPDARPAPAPAKPQAMDAPPAPRETASKAPSPEPTPSEAVPPTSAPASPTPEPEVAGEPPQPVPAHPAIPTSLREWARLRATGKLATPPETLAPADLVDPGIGAIVRRIEEFRRKREKTKAPEPANDSPRLPLGDTQSERGSGPVTIDFRTDAEGRIDWADGPYAPAVTGYSLPGHEDTQAGLAQIPSPQPHIAQALRQRLPIRGGLVTFGGTPATSGQWQVDAAACFEPVSGRFTGYCGRLRRPRVSARESAANTSNLEADRMRQVLHELRTPANAIQVAAEIVQQQLYGPAPHEYRALAASIAGDCAHILAGFEELDRLVKLETGALALDEGNANLADVASQTIRRLSGWTGPRNSGFTPSSALAEADLPTALDHDEIERLIWRLLAALAGASASDERLALDWVDHGDCVQLRLALPRTLAEREGESLFAIGEHGRGQALTAGVFGVGFTLRLAAAEANAAGGSLQRIANDLLLTLPLARNNAVVANAASHRS